MSNTASNSQKPKLIKGRDYTVRPDGAWVFSREYLLARGTCCESKCLSCPYEYSRETLDRSKMRPVISMVPSWTETLIHARLNVVGRTRFCIHPTDAVADLAVLGGTKTLSPDAAEKLEQICGRAGGARPLVVLDREENPREFFEFFSRFDCDIFVSHIETFDSFVNGLREMALCFATGASDDVDGAARLTAYAARTGVARAHLRAPGASIETSIFASRGTPREIEEALSKGENATFYLIWKNPWMVITRETWIGEVLSSLFPKIRLPHAADAGVSSSKYPELEASRVPEGSNLLFSSEPYPFAREWKTLVETPFVKSAKTAAIVDGECFSWFGIRALRFLEEANSSRESSTSADS